jgi:single-stranded-DNA-specific exonuclease
VKQRQIQSYKTHISAVAGLFLDALREKTYKVTLVHHNDADGLCAAAALARTYEVLGILYELLPIEKLHPAVLKKIFSREGGAYIVFLDLGGQNPDLIGRYAADKQPVLILDHHLPSREVPKNILCINPEDFGISGDTEISGASVAAFFAEELLGSAERMPAELAAELAVYGIIGAYGDRQASGNRFHGANQLLFTKARKHGLIAEESGTVRFLAFEPANAEKLVEVLDSLGSIGFYSGGARLGVRFLLGQDRRLALDTAADLIAEKNRVFHGTAEQIRKTGLSTSANFQWVDVQNSFYPMGVKTIGLFLEHLLAAEIPDPHKYLLGFQHFPDFQPGIGRLDLSCTKVSSRVPEELKRRILQAGYPDYMLLIPEAVGRIRGIADGCHRFAAAALIDSGAETKLIGALEDLIPAPPGGR